jgi:hypothetical protein
MDWTTEENSQLLEEMLQKAKITLRIRTVVFDDEIRDLIKAGYEDLDTRGVLTLTQKKSPLLIRAIMTYVRLNFGEPENPDRLKRSYDEQKAQLMTTTNFTDWED